MAIAHTFTTPAKSTDETEQQYDIRSPDQSINGMSSTILQTNLGSAADPETARLHTRRKFNMMEEKRNYHLRIFIWAIHMGLLWWSRALFCILAEELHRGDDEFWKGHVGLRQLIDLSPVSMVLGICYMLYFAALDLMRRRHRHIGYTVALNVLAEILGHALDITIVIVLVVWVKN